MNKRSAGVVFLSLGLLLFIFKDAIRFLVASALTFKVSGMSDSLIETRLEYVPQPYSLIIPILFIILGIVYLIWSITSKEK